MFDFLSIFQAPAQGYSLMRCLHFKNQYYLCFFLATVLANMYLLLIKQVSESELILIETS